MMEPFLMKTLIYTTVNGNIIEVNKSDFSNKKNYGFKFSFKRW